MTESNKHTLITVSKWWGFVMIPLFVSGWLFGEPIGNLIVDNKVIYCTLLWILLAMLYGKVEAYYFFYRSNNLLEVDYNPHALFTAIRSISLIFIWIIVKDWKSVACLPLLFSFFHNGAYYLQYNKLNPSVYLKRWFDQSTTSTSWMDTKHLTGPYVRTICAVVGLIGLIIINYAKY